MPPLAPEALRAAVHPFDRIDAARRGATLTRYHARRCLRRQNVGEHSHGVAMIAATLHRLTWPAQEIPSVLILAALEHDLAEHQSGDVPAPAKRRSPALKAAIDALEDDVNREFGWTAIYALTEEQARLMGAADELEFLFYCLDEIRLGNSDFRRTFALGWLGFQDRLDAMREFAWMPWARVLADRLCTAVFDLVGSSLHGVFDAARAEREVSAAKADCR